MKKLLLALGLLFGLTTFANAQCVGVGGVNTVPQSGVVCAQDSTVNGYVATGVGIIPAATPSDIACLTGSATRVIRLKRVEVSGTAGTAINIVAVLRKNLTADTLGTAGTALLVPVPYALDSTSPAPTATAISYTANPTVTGTPGVIGARTVFLPATGTAASAGPGVWDWSVATGVMPPVLRGIAQQVCVNLQGVTTPSSGLMTVSFYWSEATQ